MKDSLRQHRRIPITAGRRFGRRRGAVMVEGAIVLSVLLIMLLCMLDLGLAVLRHNTLAEAARRLTREASLHGERAAPLRPAWGPQTETGTADDGSPFAQVIEPILATFDPQEVQFEILWPDGGNRTGELVEATVTYDHHPVIPFLFGSAGPLQLRAASTMHIEH